MSNPTKQSSIYLYKILFIFISVIFITFSSCESDDGPQQLKIKNPQLIINFQDSVHSGATSDFDIEYTVDDPFIATVENNYIKGRHVGTTSVNVTSNDITENLLINVLSVYQLFDHPISNYDNGMEYYRNKYTDLYYEDDTTLVYLQVSYDEEIVYFLQFDFTNQNTTESALLVFNQGVAQLAFNTLIENYEILDHTDYAYLFGNALDIDNTSEIAIVEVDNVNLLCYVYFTQVSNVILNNNDINKVINLKKSVRTLISEPEKCQLP